MSVSTRARVPQWKTSSEVGWPRRGGRSLAVITYVIIAGWPVVFLPFQSQLRPGSWLALAIPWWIMVGGLTLLVTVARAVLRVRKGGPAVRG
jgi:hypothetical protein